jgi:hypothetical protein
MQSGGDAMHLVIEPADFARLSAGTRDEILRLLEGGGDKPAARPAASNGTTTVPPARKGFRWRAPHELNPRLVKRLLRGIDEATEKRLKLFARNDGRVTAKKLLGVTGDKDWKALSAFEGQITRRLRHLVGDDNRMISFMMWDYDSEKWDAKHETLVDGVYYVSPPTTKALKAHFGVK